MVFYQGPFWHIWVQLINWQAASVEKKWALEFDSKHVGMAHASRLWPPSHLSWPDLTTHPPFLLFCFNYGLIPLLYKISRAIGTKTRLKLMFMLLRKFWAHRKGARVTLFGTTVLLYLTFTQTKREQIDRQRNQIHSSSFHPLPNKYIDRPSRLQPS